MNAQCLVEAGISKGRLPRFRPEVATSDVATAGRREYQIVGALARAVNFEDLHKESGEGHLADSVRLRGADDQ